MENKLFSLAAVDATAAMNNNIQNTPCCSLNISNTSDSVSLGCPNTEKRVESMTSILMKFEVFEDSR